MTSEIITKKVRLKDKDGNILHPEIADKSVTKDKLADGVLQPEQIILTVTASSIDNESERVLCNLDMSNVNANSIKDYYNKFQSGTPIIIKAIVSIDNPFIGENTYYISVNSFTDYTEDAFYQLLASDEYMSIIITVPDENSQSSDFTCSALINPRGSIRTKNAIILSITELQEENEDEETTYNLDITNITAIDIQNYYNKYQSGTPIIFKVTQLEGEIYYININNVQKENNSYYFESSSERKGGIICIVTILDGKISDASIVMNHGVILREGSSIDGANIEIHSINGDKIDTQTITSNNIANGVDIVTDDGNCIYFSVSEIKEGKITEFNLARNITPKYIKEATKSSNYSFVLDVGRKPILNRYNLPFIIKINPTQDLSTDGYTDYYLSTSVFEYNNNKYKIELSCKKNANNNDSQQTNAQIIKIKDDNWDIIN